jgi:outer membrane protein TolC
MKTKTILCGTILLHLSLASPLGAETLTLQETVERILLTNPDIARAQRSVREADDEIEPIVTLEKTRLSVSGSYADTIVEGDSAPATGGIGNAGSGSDDQGWGLPFDANASLNVPIFPQMSLGGSISSRGSGEVSLSISPFASPNRTPRQIEAYQQALIKLGSLERQIAAQAESAVLNYLNTVRELEYARMALEVEEEVYSIAKQSYDLGETTVSDLQDASTKLNTVRQSYYNAQKKRLEAVKTIKLLLGPGTESPEILFMSLEDLRQLIDARNGEIAESAGTIPTSQSLETSRVSLESLQEQLKDDWPWRPNFSISGKIDIPDTSFTIGASLSFSPADLKIDSRQDLKNSIDDTIEGIAQEEYVLSLELELAHQSLEISEGALDSALTGLEQAGVLLEETKLLRQHGERTAVELRQSELNAFKAQNTAYQQAMSLLKTQNDLLLMYSRD